MKTAILALTLVLLGVVRLRSEDTQGFITTASKICVRCPLSTNTTSTLYKELRGVVLLIRLLKIRELKFPDEPFGVMVNGDDSSYDLVVWCAAGDGAEREARAEIFQAYLELRWRGISQEGAIAFLEKKKNAPADKSDLGEALKRENPWIDASYLERIQPGDSVSVWWSSERYIMRDKDVVYTVAVWTLGDGIRKTTSVFAMDPSEFVPANRKAFVAAAKAAAKEVPAGPDGKPKGVVSFWLELKRDLSKRGIKWATPDELNPNRIATWH